MEAQSVCAVLRIRAEAFTQEHPDALALMPADCHIHRTHHSIPTVTHTICYRYQLFQNTGKKTRSEERLSVFLRTENVRIITTTTTKAALAKNASLII